MSNSIVEIIRPILVNGEWVRKGQVEISTEEAKAHEAVGLVDIVSTDGHAIVWASCCTDHS